MTESPDDGPIDRDPDALSDPAAKTEPAEGGR